MFRVKSLLMQLFLLKDVLEVNQPDSLIYGKAQQLKDSAAFLGKDVRVVSAFCNLSAASLTNINEDVNCDCLISGDDSQANAIIMELAEKISGVKSIECGPLENARIVEKITPLLINLNIRNRVKLAGIRITGLK